VAIILLLMEASKTPVDPENRGFGSIREAARNCRFLFVIGQTA
jgi:hypothetical protein